VRPILIPILAAQYTFENAHGSNTAPANAIPALTQQHVQEFGMPPKQPTPFVNPQQQIQTPQSVPAMPKQQAVPKQNEEFQIASRKQVMLKDASRIIQKLKRLG
jgi:hypothetical protein